jgi:hypothetical protein
LPGYTPVGGDIDYPDARPSTTAPDIDDVNIVNYDQEPDPQTYLPLDYGNTSVLFDGIADAVNHAKDTLIPRVMTEPEILDIIRDGRMTPDVAKYVNSLPMPTLTDVTVNAGPFNRGRNDAAFKLQGPTGPPPFGGQPYSKDRKNFSNEYKRWYDTQFKPWYRNAGPREKLWVEGLRCFDPPPDFAWPNPDGSPEFIYVTFSRPGYQGVQKYFWDGLDGKKYRYRGNPPSPDMIYRPENYNPKETFPGSNEYELEWVPDFNDTTVGTNRVGRNGRRPRGINGFYFDDDDRRPPVDFLTDIINPPPPPPPLTYDDTHPTNSTISRGTGIVTNMYYGGIVDRPNVWKYCTYQHTDPIAQGTIMRLGGSGFPFYTPLSTYNPNIQLTGVVYIHNHMKGGPVGVHGMAYVIALCSQPVNIRVACSDGTYLPLSTNLPNDAQSLQFVTPNATTNFCTFTPVNGLVTVGIYIQPARNNKFNPAKSGQWFMRFDYQVTTAPKSFDITEICHFRNLDTQTPGFRAQQSLETWQVPNLDASDVVSGTVGFDSSLMTENISGTSDTNAFEMFTKAFLFIKANAVLSVNFNRGGTILNRQFTVSPADRWVVVPAGLGDIAFSNLNALGTSMTAVATTGMNNGQRACVGYRLSKLSPTLVWRT